MGCNVSKERPRGHERGANSRDEIGGQQSHTRARGGGEIDGLEQSLTSIATDAAPHLSAVMSNANKCENNTKNGVGCSAKNCRRRKRAAAAAAVSNSHKQKETCDDAAMAVIEKMPSFVQAQAHTQSTSPPDNVHDDEANNQIPINTTDTIIKNSKEATIEVSDPSSNSTMATEGDESRSKGKNNIIIASANIHVSASPKQEFPTMLLAINERSEAVLQGGEKSTPVIGGPHKCTTPCLGKPPMARSPSCSQPHMVALPKGESSDKKKKKMKKNDEKSSLATKKSLAEKRAKEKKKSAAERVQHEKEKSSSTSSSCSFCQCSSSSLSDGSSSSSPVSILASSVEASLTNASAHPCLSARSANSVLLNSPSHFVRQGTSSAAITTEEEKEDDQIGLTSCIESASALCQRAQQRPNDPMARGEAAYWASSVGGESHCSNCWRSCASHWALGGGGAGERERSVLFLSSSGHPPPSYFSGSSSRVGFVRGSLGGARAMMTPNFFSPNNNSPSDLSRAAKKSAAKRGNGFSFSRNNSNASGIGFHSQQQLFASGEERCFYSCATDVVCSPTPPLPQHKQHLELQQEHAMSPTTKPKTITPNSVNKIDTSTFLTASPSPCESYSVLSAENTTQRECTKKKKKKKKNIGSGGFCIQSNGLSPSNPAMVSDDDGEQQERSEGGGGPLVKGADVSIFDEQALALMSGTEEIGYRFRDPPETAAAAEATASMKCDVASSTVLKGRSRATADDKKERDACASIVEDLVSDIGASSPVAEFNAVRRQRKRSHDNNNAAETTKSFKQKAKREIADGKEEFAGGKGDHDDSGDDDNDDVLSVALDPNDVVLSSASECDGCDADADGKDRSSFSNSLPSEQGEVGTSSATKTTTNNGHASFKSRHSALISASSPRSVFYSSSCAASPKKRTKSKTFTLDASGVEEEKGEGKGGTRIRGLKNADGSPRLRLGEKGLASNDRDCSTTALLTVAAAVLNKSQHQSYCGGGSEHRPNYRQQSSLKREVNDHHTCNNHIHHPQTEVSSSFPHTIATCTSSPSTEATITIEHNAYESLESRSKRHESRHPAFLEAVASRVKIPQPPLPPQQQPLSGSAPKLVKSVYQHFPSSYTTITAQSVGADPRAFYAKAKLSVRGGSQDMAVFRSGIDACVVNKKPEYHLYDPAVDPMLAKAKAEGIKPYEFGGGGGCGDNANSKGGDADFTDTFIPRSTTTAASSFADLMKPTCTWDLLHSIPNAVEKVNSGDLLYRFCARKYKDLTLEDRIEVASLINLTGFDDELAENDQPILDFVLNENSEGPCEKSVAALAAAEEKRAKEAAKRKSKKTAGGGSPNDAVVGLKPPSPSEGKAAMTAYLKATSAFPKTNTPAETRRVAVDDYVVCVLRLVGFMPLATSKDGNVDCVMNVEYQRLLATYDEVFETTDRFRTYRKVKNVIPFVFSFRFQMTGSEIADDETLEEHTHHHDAKPTRIVVMERTRKHRGVDSTIKSKAFNIYYDIPPRGISSITGKPLAPEDVKAQEDALVAAALKKREECLLLSKAAGGNKHHKQQQHHHKNTANLATTITTDDPREAFADPHANVDLSTPEARKRFLDAFLPAVPGGVLVQHTAIIIRSSIPTVLSGMVEALGNKLGKQATGQIFLVRQFLHQKKLEKWDVMEGGGDNPHTGLLWET